MEKIKLRILVALLLCLVLCSACSPNKIKGKPPFLSISSLSAQEESLSAKFDIRNINDVELVIDSIEITIRVREVELTRYFSQMALTVDPNATEEVMVEDMPDEFARPLLAELERGDVASLPFFLEGRVHTRDDGYLPFRHEGHLYPIPGKPGTFRSATSRTREQR